MVVIVSWNGKNILLPYFATGARVKIRFCETASMLRMAIKAIDLHNGFVLQKSSTHTHCLLPADILVLAEEYSNMVNDYRDAIRITAICLSLCSLSSVSTRIYRSYFILGRLAWHDMLIIIALVSVVP